MKRKPKKPKKIVVKVLVDPCQKAQISANAHSCHMSLSCYCRILLTTGKPPAQVNTEHLKPLFKLHGDLGRLGGLLKMLLTNHEKMEDIGREFGLVTIDGILTDLRFSAAGLKEMVENILTGKNRIRE